MPTWINVNNMQRNMKPVTTCFLLLASSFLVFAQFPSEFTRCEKNGKLNECLSAAIEEAIRVLAKPIPGLPSLEPLKISSVPVKVEGKDANIIGEFTNYEMWGATKNVTVKAKMDFEENKLELEPTFPELRHKFNCAFNGTFKGESITGHGSAVCIAEDEKLPLIFTLGEHKMRDETYYEVEDTQILFTVKKRCTCKFEKYEGQINNTQLENLINTNMMDFWMESIVSNFRRPFEIMFQNAFNTILSVVPIDELFIE